jgi:hypothetical protein
MCLEYKSKKSVKRFRDFLKTAKRGFVICYGTAIKIDNEYLPACYGIKAYKRGWNASKKKNKEDLNYVPHFHRWVTLEGAKNWLNKFLLSGNGTILIWKVPIKDITAVGFQCCYPVIVTKRCKLLGEVEL